MRRCPQPRTPVKARAHGASTLARSKFLKDTPHDSAALCSRAQGEIISPPVA